MKLNNVISTLIEFLKHKRRVYHGMVFKTRNKKWWESDDYEAKENHLHPEQWHDKFHSAYTTIGEILKYFYMLRKWVVSKDYIKLSQFIYDFPLPDSEDLLDYVESLELCSFFTCVKNPEVKDANSSDDESKINQINELITGMELSPIDLNFMASLDSLTDALKGFKPDEDPILPVVEKYISNTVNFLNSRSEAEKETANLLDSLNNKKN